MLPIVVSLLRLPQESTATIRTPAGTERECQDPSAQQQRRARLGGDDRA